MALSPARLFTAANSEYFSLADNSVFDVATTTNYWFGWGYINATGTRSVIFSKIVADVDIGYQYSFRYETTDKLRFVVGYGATDYAIAATTSSVAATTWFFWEAYIDKVNNLIGVSVNREADVTAALSSDVRAGTGDFRIGTQFNVTPQYPWDGRLQAMGFTSGLPTGAERTAIYNSTAPGVLYSNRPSLSAATYLAFWNGDEASGNLVDSTGTYTMTDNNTVTTAAGIVLIPSAASSVSTNWNRNSIRIGLGV